MFLKESTYRYNSNRIPYPIEQPINLLMIMLAGGHCFLKNLPAIQIGYPIDQPIDLLMIMLAGHSLC
jgi:hypothetical protein